MTNIPKQCPSCGGNCGRKNGVCQYGGIKTKPKIKPLKWFTTDKPLADGYYWKRLRMSTGRKSICYVRDGEFKDVIYDGWNDKFHLWEFKGPIPEPEE